MAAFCKEVFEDEEAVDENATEGGRSINIADKASDDEEYHEADSEDEGLGKDSDDKELFDLDSDSNDDGKNNNDEIKARLLYSMKKNLANVTTRVNEGGSDIIDRIRFHLSNRIKENASTNDADPVNLVDEERRMQTPATFGLKSIGF